METLRKWAGKLRSETWVLYRASTDSNTPWYAKAFILLVIAYALSPIDLIPDFIPVIGYLDDLILIPLGIYLGSKMIPLEVLDKYRKAAEPPTKETTKLGSIGAMLVFFAWLLLIALLIYWAKSFMETG
jgi:uncharacterized membrane protein YkvA (DUF1232 family)